MLIGYNFERTGNYATDVLSRCLFVWTEENKSQSPESLFRGRD